jgi:peptidoglycan/LPS O-acetylase OafA/YrhL
MDDRLSDTSTWLQERVDGWTCATLAASWFVLLQVATALEPATNRTEPFYGVALELAMWLLLATMVTGLVMQRRFGQVASLAAAGFLTAMSIACPVSGHHPFGTWWYGQITCVLALLAISAVVLRRSLAHEGGRSRTRGSRPAQRTSTDSTR